MTKCYRYLCDTDASYEVEPVDLYSTQIQDKFYLCKLHLREMYYRIDMEKEE